MEKKQTLSYEQDLASTPTENVWVQANAGTGKTSVLVQRLLRILFRAPDWGKCGILCLTYTNAGAGEMRNRILSSLRQWAVASDAQLIELLDGVAINCPATSDDIAHAREIFFKFIDAPEILKIKTIHGFCEEVLHRFPIEAGLSPSWSLISDDAQRSLLQDVFTNLINSPINNGRVYDAFAHIVGRVSENYMTDLLDILSDQYKHFFQIDNFDNYRNYFIDTTENFLKLSNVPSNEFDVETLQNIIKNTQDDINNAKKPATYLTDIVNKTKQYIDTTIDFEEYKKVYLKADGNRILNVSKKDYLVQEQNRVYELDQYNENKMLFDDTVALFDLSAAFASEYRRIKRERGLLDFEDLILYTRRLFSNAETMGWVLSQLDLSLSHILVDEAQDTSPLQWDILRMLSGDFLTEGDTAQNPHSLFVVGDTKQSIFGFQGADPRAFASSREAISKQIAENLRTIREVPLTQSFRSTAPILYSVDKFFADDAVIETSEFANNPHKCFRANEPGLVELHRLVTKAETGATVAQYTEQIADKIKSMIDSGACAARDIMVLVQRRNPMASPLTIALKRRGIDVAGSDRIVLPDFPAVRDMLNLARWCLNTADDFSLCCVLKSPFFCLTERDIFDLCKIKNDTNTERKRASKDATQTTVFEVLQQAHPDIYMRLDNVLQKSQIMAPYSFFDYVLNDNDAQKNFIAALGDQVIDPLAEFMTICLSYERTQPGTLHHFLKWFITGGSEIKRDMNAASGVRIVTVHSSKGLEAPIVFLIDTIHTPKSKTILPIPSDGRPVWLWTPRGKNSECARVAANDSTRTDAREYYRLLYVAMTRPRDQLYIYGYTPNKNATPDSWYAHLWRVLANNATDECIRITNDDIK